MRVRPSDALKELTLLYVEDDEAIREALSILLRRYVKKLFVAENGRKGLELFAKHNPNIVISDIRMPQMSGLEMVESIKESDPGIPVIFTTAFSETEYLKSAIDLGVEGYLVKPIERDKLLSKLNFIADAIVNERRKDAYFKLLVRLFDSHSEAFVLVKESGEVVLSNLSFKKMALYIGCDSIDNIYDVLSYANADNGCFKLDMQCSEDLSGFFEEGSQSDTICFKVGRKSIYYEFQAKKIDEYYFFEFKDITEYKRETKILALENYTDSLSGLYNRKYEAILKKECIDLKEKVCFLFIDIDFFKRVNDTFGHTVGDEVIKFVAKKIKSHLRTEDIALRWGGEEFLVVIKTDVENAKTVAEKIRRVIESAKIDPVGHITISVGVCCGIIESEDDFYKTIDKADEALYRAKKCGRNRVKIANGAVFS